MRIRLGVDIIRLFPFFAISYYFCIFLIARSDHIGWWLCGAFSLFFLFFSLSRLVFVLCYCLVLLFYFIFLGKLGYITLCWALTKV